MSYIIGIVIFVVVLILLFLILLALYTYALPLNYYIINKAGAYMQPFQNDLGTGINFTTKQPPTPNWNVTVVPDQTPICFYLETEYNNGLKYRALYGNAGDFVGLVSGSDPGWASTNTQWVFTKQSSVEPTYLIQPSNNLDLTLAPQGVDLATITEIDLANDILTVYK